MLARRPYLPRQVADQSERCASRMLHEASECAEEQPAHPECTSAVSDYKQKNKLRVAAVWMDDYARYVSGFNSAKGADHGDVSERVALRRRLNCRSFQWCAAALRRATYAGRPSELLDHTGISITCTRSTPYPITRRASPCDRRTRTATGALSSPPPRRHHHHNNGIAGASTRLDETLALLACTPATQTAVISAW